jgi:hypothetical protein
VIELDLKGFDEASKVLTEGAKRLPKAIASTVDAEAEATKAAIVASIEGGDFPPLTPLGALFGKGGDRHPLMDFVPDLRVIRQGDAVFIGFRGRRGELAALNEQGAAYTVHTSDRQRRYVMAILREGGVLGARDPHPNPPGTPLILDVKIPSRPFFERALERQLAPASAEPRLAKNLAREMKGTLGKP